MFNILNKEIREGKNSPMVRKFLHSLSAFSHGILDALRGSPISLSEWILEIARRSQLAFELPF